MKRLAWISDIHLNFVDARGRQEFYQSISAAQPSELLVGGDIGEASSLIGLLKEMAAALPGLPIYFVLGNHDFYGSSMERVREGMIDLTSSHRQLTWLTSEDYIDLGNQSALIGDDGWADGRLGDYERSTILLNDYLRIAEFIPSLDDKQQRLQLLNQLGDEAAARVHGKLLGVLKNPEFRQIVFLTHAPPFREACWHEGGLSGLDWLPHFTCKAIGDVLVEVMEAHSDKQMTVLCGHTHSSGVAQIRPNLIVRTAAAEYGQPALQSLV